ncbi:MAG TPA: hypothetical protein VH592_17675, partial [Gemmataceae bacterium]
MAETARIRCPSSFAVAGGIIVFATLAFLNLDGYHNEPFRHHSEPFGPDSFYQEPPDINWTHGWPFVCAGRTSVGTGPLVVVSVQHAITSRWPFDGTPFTYVYRGPLYADVAILVAAVIATVWSINSLTWGSKRRPSFGLKFLFGMMSLTAVALIARS